VLYTGDIGYLDAEGYVYVLDRKKDLVFVGGHNVFPGKIEKTIMEHPAVDEVAVIGVPDDYFGYCLKAFVVLREGPSDFSQRTLDKFLSGKLAGYEIPAALEIRASLPKTNVGKIAKQDLLNEALARRKGDKDGPTSG